MRHSQRAEELFHEVVELESEEQTEFLERACVGDTALRLQVECLLRADRRDAGVMDRPAIEAFPDFLAGTPEIPMVVGPFRIKRKIASGGMGTVYEAVQEQPRRAVALKVMRSDLSSPSLVSRFRREATVLARLRHPGVAHVYEAGIHEHGTWQIPYIAMEYIPDARPITEFADQEDLGIRDRLRLFASVCDAVHHGHQKGVIHRDLKPANILVDGRGDAKIIDFGVARVIDVELQTTAHTEFGILLGTIQYMSPEQCAGEVEDLDTRTDVYSLGVVLYELLCGALPYDVTHLPIPQAAVVIQDELPRRPSTRVHLLRGDLETITLKALEKEPDRRYPSAAELGQDVRRFLEREPIQARPPSLAYKARMFARRHTVAVVALLLITLALLSATAVSTIFAYRAEQSRQRERMHAYLANIAVADAALRIFDVVEARRRLEQTPPDLRHWEWQYLAGRLDRSVHTARGAGGHCVAVVLDDAAQRRVAAWVSEDRKESTIRVRDVAGDVEEFSYGPFLGMVTCLDLSPDGSTVAWGTSEKTIVWWDLTGGESPSIASHGSDVTAVAFDRSGTRLASGGYGDVRLWQLSTGRSRERWSDPAEFVHALVFDPGGRSLASAGTDGSIRIRDVTTGTVLRTLVGHAGTVVDMAWDEHAHQLVSASFDGTVRVWDPETGDELGRLTGHRQEVSSVAVSGDGNWIVSGSDDGTLKLWDSKTRVERSTLWGHTSMIRSVAVNADASMVFSSSLDGTIKIWNPVHVGDATEFAAHGALIRSLAFSPDNRLLACGGFDETIQLYDLESSRDVVILKGHEDGVMGVSFSPDSSRLASASNDGTTRIWNLDTGASIATLSGHDSGVSTVAFSPDGKWLATGSTDESAILWDPSRGEQSRVLRGRSWLWAVAFSPQSDRLATAWADGMVRVWDVESGRELRSWQAHSDSVYCVAFHPNGETLATGSRDRTIKLWSAESGQQLAVGRGHSLPVQAVAFNPDGTRLASASEDTTVRLWDGETVQEILSLRGHGAWVFTVAFSPDGRRIASGGGNYEGVGCTTRLWDSESSGE